MSKTVGPQYLWLCFDKSERLNLTWRDGDVNDNPKIHLIQGHTGNKRWDSNAGPLTPNFIAFLPYIPHSLTTLTNPSTLQYSPNALASPFSFPKLDLTRFLFSSTIILSFPFHTHSISAQGLPKPNPGLLPLSTSFLPAHDTEWNWKDPCKHAGWVHC